MPKPPNFLLIMTDQQRQDSLGCYGNRFVRTPNIDAFAREAMRFDTCVTPFPVCTPARASLWTGLYPHAHGVIDNVYGVEDALQSHGLVRDTIFDWLKAAGYLTAYFGKWHLGDGQPAWADEWQGLNSLGGHWVDGRQSFQGGRYKPDEQTDACIDFIRRQAASTRPFIAVQSYYPPHDPYAAPEEFYRPYRGSGVPFPAYYAAVSAIDACTGRLFQALEDTGQSAATVVIYLSDHGETFGFRDDSIHKHVCYDDAIRVPLLIRAPGVARAGEVSAAPVGLQDVAPTCAELAGTSPPRAVHGQSLVGLLAGRDAGWRRQANYVQNRTRLNGYVQRAVRTADWKLILSDGGASSMFDLATDPEELFDIIDAPRADDPHDRYRHFEDQQPRRRDLARLLGRCATEVGDKVGKDLASAFLDGR